MQTSNDTFLVEQALEMAVTRRRTEPGLLHHSDQGSVSTSQFYQAKLAEVGF